MANPRIEVEIGAKVDMLTKAIDEALVDLDKLGGKSTETSKEVDQISVVSQRASTKIEQVGKESAQTANQINKLANATSGYNSIGTDFARIIQDAPFGIIGVGNNITQLASSFQTLRAQSTSTGAALKTAFASIIAPANLLVLGISAVTTALTVYAMTAKDTTEPISGLKQAQDDFNESLKETDRLLGKEVFGQFLKEVGLVEQQNIAGRLIDVPTFQNAAQVVDKLSGKISSLRKGELDLLAKFFQTQIAESLRTASNSSEEFVKTLAQQDINLYQGLLDKVNVQLAFYKTNSDSAKKSTKDFNNEVEKLKRTFESIAELPKIGLPVSGDVEALRARREQLQAGGQVGQTGPEFINAQLEAVKAQGIFTQLPSQLSAFSDQYQEFASTAGVFTNELINGFSTLGNQIASSLNIGNDALRGFVSTVLSNTPKIIQAIFQQAAARKVAAKIENQGNLQVATGNAVATASKAANALGPVGLALLPVFIGGAIALISSAFNKSGGGGGGLSVGSSGLGSGTSFKGGGLGFAFDPNREIRGELVARGQDLVYVFNEANNRINKG